MKVLIIGSGGREHALAWKLSQSPRVSALHAAPGSDAISEFATCHSANDIDSWLALAQSLGIDFTVIGPETPLVEGMADRFSEAGLAVFGPNRAAAQLEGSKSFSKDFMARHNIPTASYAVFEDLPKARDHVQKNPGPWVIKADGLAAGKGVVICHSEAEALEALEQSMESRVFGEAGRQVVIESFLVGEEASYFVLSDGEDFISLPSAQDHKPVGELDTGPNTGGMGAYCPAPVVSPQVEQRILDEVVRPTLMGMASEGHPYRGVLYVGLMIHEGAPSVVEYNCRFGDPECQPMVMLLESDLLDLLEASAQGGISAQQPKWHEGAAACVVMTAQGYPGSYAKGHPISGLEHVQAKNAPGGNHIGGKATVEDASDQHTVVFHAGTKRSGEAWLTNGGRVLGVTTRAETLSSALRKGYGAIDMIHWLGANFRKDIGLKGLKHNNGDRPAVNVGILMGSVSDIDVARKATAILDKLGIGHEVAVASAHRTPERVSKFIGACIDAGAETFIAIAGMAAALPGVVAAHTELPVIGVPVKSSAFEGTDALLSIVQMPPGIPVATVGVGAGANAALLVAAILAVKYPDVAAALKEYRLGEVQKVSEAHRKEGLSTLV